MANKTPYEIRLDVLKMAQEMMDKELELKRNEQLRRIDLYVQSKDNICPEEILSHHDLKMYSPEEVITKATQLYNFVSDSSSTRENILKTNRK
jgi:hypothetical protein